MLNKKLEERLKKGGFKDIINWLEKCERGKIKVLEIRVDKKVGITNNKMLDRAIINYLQELNIKVVYNEYNFDSKKDTKNPKCKHFCHKLYNKKLNHEDNVSNFLENKIAMFKIDSKATESYAICPECTSMITIS